GSMINPDTSGLHGYDSGLFAPFQDNRYKPWLNVALGVSPGTPLVVPNASSLVSTISRPGDPTVFAPNGSMSQLQTAAVLTVLAVEPPEDAFRPPYVGADKTLRFRESDLHYGNLARVAPAGTPPSFAATAPKFQRVWLEHISGWATRFMHPVDNMMDYGRDFTTEYGTGALLAQLDVPDSTKRDLVVGLTQIGIDFHRNAQTASWPGEGGHGSGRKFPILFAGAVLNDASLLAIGQTHPSAYHGPSNPNNSSRFGEDCQTFYVQQTSPGVYNWGFGGYTSTLNNTAEWGFGHTNNIGADDSSWLGNSYRRCCTANAWVGQTLCARMMGLVSAWNHPAYFDYQDRYMQTELTSWRAWNPWHETMWDAYRATY
ncbi:MAG: hypothetical protein KDE27_19250, partial [Planctomycetes bacterium]|nr:hypothetical protein [Planctomycetota bacterium]